MPYLGSTPNASFSSRTKQDFTANGSTTAFTLSSAVASPNDIEVFVGNVRQEPTDAYTVNGTTLTMSEAPATGLNFYAIHTAGTIESSVVPAAGTTVPGNFGVSGDLNVDTDTLFVDASADKVGINNSAPNHELQINGNATTSSLSLKTSATGNATSDGLELKVQGDSAAYLYNYENAMLRFGTNGLERVRIDASGHITMPNQPAFMAYKSGNQSLTAHTLTKITGWNEVVDQSNEWDNTNGTFTATSGGIYLFGILMQANVNGGLHCMVRKNGNNGLYGDNYLDGGDISGGSYTILMPMVANDYVEYLAYLTVNGNINGGRSKVWAVKVA